MCRGMLRLLLLVVPRVVRLLLTIVLLRLGTILGPLLGIRLPVLHNAHHSIRPDRD